MSPSAAFTVVICTRNRSDQLEQTLRHLDAQTFQDFPVIVVDQSDRADARLAERAERSKYRLDVVQDSGRGLSRAANLGWRHARSEWVVYLDDDCLPDPDWAEQLNRVLARDDVSFVSGHVGEYNVPEGEYLRVSVFEVLEARTLSGRWTPPWEIGLGVCMAVRRSVIERLDGFDERFGPGVPDFPASGDMDFNYRFLRSGGVAATTPDVRTRHDQWRTPAELGPLFRGYHASWSGFAMKHLRRGDVAGGLWLWTAGLLDALRMLASSVKRCSGLRFRVAIWKFRGIACGTWKGLTKRW